MTSESRTSPKHVAIIMDGNRRWAKRRHRPPTIGYRVGARAVNLCIDYCLQQGVEVLTLFAFSSENWGRPQEEVSGLMKLFMHALEREVNEMHRRGIRVRFIGDRSRFQQRIQERMQQAEWITQQNSRLTLCIAASYGGRQDIALACRRIAEDVAAGKLQAKDIGEEHIQHYIALADLPAPDLFIRTGGDIRISNFLLWQLAYTELWFTDTLWPDVTTTTLDQAFSDYTNRERRFGLTSEQIARQENQA